MKFITICFVLLLVSVPLVTFSNEIMTIELTDGSVISGEVVSLIRGMYTIKSNDLGTLKIEESKIKVIRSNAPSVKSVGQNTEIKDQMESMQAIMMNNPEVLSIILSLKDDPKFQAVLRDPDVMSAVQAGDIATLSKNSKFMSLLDDPRVQQIGGKVK